MAKGVKSIYIPNGYIVSLYNMFTVESLNKGLSESNMPEVLGAFEIGILNAMIAEEFNKKVAENDELGIKIFSGPFYVTELVRPDGSIYRDSKREEYLNIVNCFEECSGVKPEFKQILNERSKLATLVLKYILSLPNLPQNYRNSLDKNISMMLDNPLFRDRLTDPKAVALLRSNMYFLKPYTMEQGGQLIRDFREYVKSPYCIESIDQNTWGRELFLNQNKFNNFLNAFKRAVARFNQLNIVSAYTSTQDSKLLCESVKQKTKELNYKIGSKYIPDALAID